jgi:hypothetical protein
VADEGDARLRDPLLRDGSGDDAVDLLRERKIKRLLDRPERFFPAAGAGAQNGELGVERFAEGLVDDFGPDALGVSQGNGELYDLRRLSGRMKLV